MLSRTFVGMVDSVAISPCRVSHALAFAVALPACRHPVGNDIVNVMIHLAAVGGLLFFPVLRAEHMDSTRQHT